MDKPVDPRQDFDDATRNLLFTKDFHDSTEAIMHDPIATNGQRFMAWLKRRAWGNYRLYAAHDDSKEPATQADCAHELRLDKRIISNLVAYYEKRGYLRREAKLLYPAIIPKLGLQLEKLTRSPHFSAFLEEWKVTRSSEFESLEVARSTVKRIRKVILSDYKRWLALKTNGAPSLKRVERTTETTTIPAAQPASEVFAVVEFVVAQKLREYGTTTDRAVRRLVHDCRAQAPGCALDAITKAIDRVGLTIRKNGKIDSRIRNAIGLLIDAVPSTVAAIRDELSAEQSVRRNVPKSTLPYNKLSMSVAQSATSYSTKPVTPPIPRCSPRARSTKPRASAALPMPRDTEMPPRQLQGDVPLDLLVPG